MIVSNGKCILHIDRKYIPKPISMYSEDPTDFEYKKYMLIGTDYILEDESGEIKYLSESEAREMVDSWQHSQSPVP